MKSAEVYKTLKAEFAPWFKSAGFKRANAMLSWSKPYGDDHIMVLFQVSQDGWDTYAGSKFIIEFQRSKTPVVGTGLFRKRISFFCSATEMEEIRSIQNEVIGSLEAPPTEHYAFHVTPLVSEWYKEKFLLESAPYPEGQDIWFRYSKPEHLVRWSRFLLLKLPGCVATVERSA